MPEEDHNERLARELASTLDDEAHLSLYRKYARTLPRDILEKILTDALAVPAEKIKKSRGALFTYLAQKYVHKRQNHHWN